jgi:ABC-type transport system involved in Fe-S cluster assembly fused permease/ATPase subunit
VIAHRLATIVNADKLLWTRDLIVEEGTHQELIIAKMVLQKFI